MAKILSVAVDLSTRDASGVMTTASKFTIQAIDLWKIVECLRRLVVELLIQMGTNKVHYFLFSLLFLEWRVYNFRVKLEDDDKFE